MDRSTPGLPVHHQLPELSQTHVHQVSDATQPSHPLSSPSPLAFILSQHQGLFMSQFFASDGQSIGVSASASVLPMNIQDWFPLELTCLISLQSKGLSRVFSNPTAQKHQFFGTQLSLYSPTLIHTYMTHPSIHTYSHPYMTTGKAIALTRWTFVGKVMSLLFNRLSRLVIAFLPRSRHLLISWLQSPSEVLLEPKKIKSVTVSSKQLYSNKS